MGRSVGRLQYGYRARRQKRPNGFGIRAYVWRVKGELARAIADYEKSIELDPDKPQTMNDLAWLLATEKNAAVRGGGRGRRIGDQSM